MKRFIAILLLLLPACFGHVVAQTLEVTPLNGVVVDDNKRALFTGSSYSYRLELVTQDSISADGISLKVNDIDLSSKCRVEKGVLKIDNISVPADTKISSNNFELSYYKVEMKTNENDNSDNIDSVENKDEETKKNEDAEEEEVRTPVDVPEVSMKVHTYNKPSKKPVINPLQEKNSAIENGEFSFNASGFDDNIGDPEGWKFEWYVDNKKIGTKDAPEDDFKYTFQSSVKKIYNVTVKAINRINGSNDNEGKVELSSQNFSVTIYQRPSLTITSLPDRVAEVDNNVTATVKFEGGHPSGWNNIKVTIDDTPVDSKIVSSNETGTTIECPYNLIANKDMEIKVEASNSHNTMLPYSGSISDTRNMRVYFKPTVNFEELSGGEHIYDQEELTCKPKGGDPDGWEYTWTIDGNPSNIKEKTFIASAQSLKEGFNTVRVVVSNKVSNKNYLTVDNTWSFYVWSAPSDPTATGDFVYYGEKAQITVKSNGGYKGTGGGWKYRLLKDGDPLTNEYVALADGESIMTDNVTTETTHSGNTITAYELQAVNLKADGSEWKSFKVPVKNLRGYKKPHVQVAPKKMNLYYNEKAAVDAHGDDGVDDSAGAWEHTVYFSDLYESKNDLSAPTDNWNGWHIGNENLTSIMLHENKALAKRYLSMAVVSSNGTLGKRTYFANGERCETREDAIRRAQETALVVTVWPKVNFGAKKTEAIKVREGDEFQVEVPEVSGGYYDATTRVTKAEYSYSYNGQNINKLENPVYRFETEYNLSKGQWSKDMQTSDVTYTVYAMSPDGKEVWDQKDYSQPVVVYSRPAAPSQVMLKGNGTSNSFVVMMPVSNNDLTAKGYHFAFCSDSAVLKDGTDRIAVLSGHTTMDVKATTYWTYPDGSVVYSDFLDCRDNITPCGWSTFDGSGPHSRVTVDEMTEGIDAVVVDNVIEVPVLHDMQGRRVNEPQRGGMYVVNGKKVIFK